MSDSSLFIQSISEDNPLPTHLSLFKSIYLGYLPSGLPPSFRAYSFARQSSSFVDLLPSSADKLPESDSSKFEFPKYGTTAAKRTAALIPPMHYLYIIHKMYLHWDYFFRFFTACNHEPLPSTSIPTTDISLSRYLVPSVSISAHHALQAKYHSIYKYMLKFDINAFYGSIYSHAIHWSFAGIEDGKKYRKLSSLSEIHSTKKRYNNLIGLELDIVMSRVNRGETYGIAIGNDVSFVVGELVGSAIASSIAKTLKRNNIDFAGYRHVDDFFLFFHDESTAHKALKIVNYVLSEYHLTLNKTKTYIMKDTGSRISDWVRTLSYTTYVHTGLKEKAILSDSIDGKVFIYEPLSPHALRSYFAQLHDLQDQYPDEGVMKFGIRRLHFNDKIDPTRGIGFPYLMCAPGKFGCYSTLDVLLSSLLIKYPSLIDFIVDVYLWYEYWWNSKGINITPRYFKHALPHVMNHLDHFSHFELLWLFWAARKFNVELPNIAKHVPSLGNNPFVLLQLIDYVTNDPASNSTKMSVIKKLRRSISPQGILRKFAPPSSPEDFLSKLRGSNWIFFYEMYAAPARVHIYFPKYNIYKTSDSFISALQKKKIHFFHWDTCVRKIDYRHGPSRRGRGGMISRGPYPV